MSFHGGPGRGGGARRPAGPLPLVVSSHLLQKAPENLSQNMVDHFWSRFTAKNPGKATTLLPKNELAERLSKRRATKDLAGGGSKTTATSYEEAAAACRAKVAQIVLECRRVNQKYRDPHFDLDYDLKSANRYCLESLSNDAIDYRPPPDPGFSSRSGSSDESSSRQNRKRNHRRLAKDVGRGRSAYLLYGERNSDAKGKRSGKETKRAPGGYESSEDDDSQSPVLGRVGSNKLRGPPGAQFNPRSVKRVGDIFDDPKFYIEGPTANDIRQGADGDCWFMAALCTLTNKPGLVEKICVARDEIVGVYGFVFHRDGEWVSEIIDDKLYLKKPDYDERQSTERQRNLDRELWDEIDRQDPDEIYRKTYQANSTALYFAQCEHPNETWLPLLEKAYAKAHGDYAAIDGGFTGEGIEDLTGGVTSELFTTDILDREHFWNEELMKVNDEFLFGCSTGDWRGFGDRRGIKERHAYSVMRAVEIDGERLVLLKNPWGKGEWQGAWSDGSKEWTAEWLQKLDHKFGDDGAFWISYKDLLRKYQHFDRTRLFDDKWKVVSMWTTLNVSWAPDYHDTKFSFTLEKSGPVVIVLSQLDDRYFRGFEGAYTFGIGLRLHKAGEKDYLVRTQTTYRMTRSCNVELNLEAGEYTVLVKVDATRRDNKLAPEDVIRLNTKYRREKVLRIAMAYDLAHSKAQIVETPEEKEAREKHEKRQKDKYRKKMRKAVESERRKQYQQECRGLKMERKMRAHEHAWRKQHNEKREAKRKAAEEARQKEWEREQAERLAFAKNRQAAANGKDPAEKERRPGAEVKVGDVEAKAAEPDRAPEPEVSTDAGEHTPPTSTNSASERTAEKAAEGGNIVAAPTEEKTAEEKTPEKEISKEKASEEKASGEKLPEEEAVQKPTAEAKTSEEGPSGTQETVKPEDNQPEKVSEEEEAAGGTQTTFATAATELPASSDEPEHPPKIPAQDAAAPAPALFRDQSPHRGVELQQRIKRALNVVTNVERELHGLLQYTQGGPPSERDDGTASYDEEQEEEEQEQEQHSRHFHRPPHPHRLQQHVPGPHHRLADHNRYIPRSRDNSPQPPRRNNPPPPAPPSYMSGPPDPRFRPRQRPGFHMPPPPPPPFQPPFQDDSEPESIMPPCSPLEVSDTELDCMLKDNEQEVMRIINRGPPPAPHPSGMPPVMVTRGRSPPPPVGPYQARGGGRVMFGQDVDEPWNAVAVVGLRIYYKVDGGGGDGDGEGGGGDASKEGVKLRVVRPIYFDDSSSDDDDDDDDDDKDDHDKGKKKEKKEEEEEEERDGEKEVEETKVLDVDDSAKDAIEEVEGGAKE